MIEINLLPGARKPKRAAGTGGGLGAMFAGATSQIKDGFLIFGIVGLVAGLGVVGFLWLRTSAREADLNGRLQQAVQDSTRFAAVLREREAVEAQRDSVLRQLNIIRTIDGERYTWPHMLDELSEALPPVTWLTEIRQMSPVQSVTVRDSAALAAAKRAEAVSDVVAEESRLRIRVVGQTFDFQALTRYMRLLESSPFIERVTLFGSTLVAGEAGGLTQFTLDMQAQPVDPSAVRRVPLTIAVR